MTSAETASGAPFCPHNGTTHDGTVVCHWASGPGTRGTLNIFWLCISTLGICVWRAVHPDVPHPRSSSHRKLKARIAWLLVGLFMPEMLVLTALGQLREAIELLVEVERDVANIPCEFPWWMTLRNSWKPKNQSTKFRESFWMKAPRCPRPRAPADRTQPEKSGYSGASTMAASWWNLLRRRADAPPLVRRRIRDSSQIDAEKTSSQHQPFLLAPAIGPPPASSVHPPDASGSPPTAHNFEPSESSQPVASRPPSPTPTVQTASAAILARKHPWTLTHSLYAVMGGYYAGHRFWDPSRGCDHSEVIESLQLPLTDPMSIPDMNENALSDRSKVDGLAKLLLVWQLFVFLANCVARWNQHLPLSLLEITTISHSLCSLVALVLWWYKPHSIGEVTMIGDATALEDPSSLDLGDVVNMVLPGRDLIDIPRTIMIFAIAALYGLPHLLGREVPFPSFAEKILWNIATFAVIGLPLIMCFTLWINRCATGLPDVIESMSWILLICLGLYPVCSMFLVGESLRQVFALPMDSFREPQLALYLPSFS